MPAGASEVTAQRIAEAHLRIPAAFRDSAQFVVESLSAELGSPVIVKVETVNPIGCFKGRGTWLAVEQLVRSGEVGAARPVVVASAGNFGQGVAYAARALGVPSIIFAAANANASKVRAMQLLSADVRLGGKDFDAAREAAAAYVAANPGHLLVDGHDPRITIGAGTIGLELTTAADNGQLPVLEAIYVPVGNGALIAGIGSWYHAMAASTRVIGVQAERAPAMTLSWRARRPISTERADTIADGIAARVPVAAALEIMLGAVDDMVLVSEEQIIDATAALQAALPLAVEASAGAAWAAILNADRPIGAVGMVLTGGNTVR